MGERIHVYADFDFRSSWFFSVESLNLQILYPAGLVMDRILRPADCSWNRFSVNYKNKSPQSMRLL